MRRFGRSKRVEGWRCWSSLTLVMVIVYAVALVGLVAWMARLWRRSPRPPSWAALVAFVLVGLGAWCIFEMAASFFAEQRVSRRGIAL